MSLRSRRLLTAGVTLMVLTGYFLVTTVGLRHVAILGLLGTLLLVSRPTRSLGISLVPATVFAFAYDALGLLNASAHRRVLIEPIWRLESYIFGWMGGPNQPLGPVDVFRDTHWGIVDAIGGVVYSAHLVPAFVFGIFVWWIAYRNDDSELRRRLSVFWWGFVAINILAFTIHALMPVAPPWYVQEYGFVAPLQIVSGDPAGLARVDAILGIDHFAGIYSKGAYVFGALPSLHVALPAWVAINTRRRGRMRAMRVLTMVMSFYAVYFSHHYLLDVVAGLGLSAGVWVALTRTPVRNLPVAGDRILRALLADPMVPPNSRIDEMEVQDD